jgi:hypothetical protein
MIVSGGGSISHPEFNVVPFTEGTKVVAGQKNLQDLKYFCQIFFHRVAYSCSPPPPLNILEVLGGGVWHK